MDREEYMTMHLKVLLPFRVLTENDEVTRMVMETDQGSYGILPHRLDCVAAIVPGIFTYETADEVVHYMAVDEGILVKSGRQVMLSVRNAMGGADLGELHTAVEKEFVHAEEGEKNIRTVMAKLESSFIYRLEKLHKA
jgi:F-type H+-transporting ATPase subunit epsilon